MNETQPFERHEAVKNSLISDPSLLKLDNIIGYQEEVPYYKQQRMVGCADLVFYDQFGQRYVIEITTGNSNKSMNRVKRQAKRAKRYFPSAAVISVIASRKGMYVRWH